MHAYPSHNVAPRTSHPVHTCRPQTHSLFLYPLPTSNDALVALAHLGMTASDKEVFQYAVCQLHLTGLLIHWADIAPTDGKKKRKSTDTTD